MVLGRSPIPSKPQLHHVSTGAIIPTPIRRVGEGSVNIVQTLAPWNFLTSTTKTVGRAWFHHIPKGWARFLRKFPSVTTEINGAEGWPKAGFTPAGAGRDCHCPCLPPLPRRSPRGRVSAALILSGLRGVQPDPGAAPSGGPGPQCGLDPGRPRRPTRVPAGIEGRPGSRRRPRGKGHDWAPRDRRCGVRGGAPPATLWPPAGPRGLRLLASRCSQRAGSRDSRGGAPPPRKSQPRPGRGSLWASRCGTPAPHFLGNLLGGRWEQPRRWRN